MQHSKQTTTTTTTTTSAMDLIHVNSSSHVLTLRAAGFESAVLDRDVLTTVFTMLRDGDIRELVLQRCELEDSTALRVLLDILTSCVHLRSVNLNGCQFASREDFSRLLRALATNTSITDLDLSTYLSSSSDYLAGDGALREFLGTNTTVTKLNLTGHTLTVATAQEIAHGLRSNHTLRTLHLHSCDLDEEKTRFVLEGARDGASLTFLDIGSNNRLSSHFLNSTLTTFVQAQPQLQTLVLDHNSRLFASGSTAIGNFLKMLRDNQSSLTKMSLRYCKLTPEMGEALLETLEYNTQLEHVNLEFTGFGLKGKSREILMRTMPKWKYLQTLKIHTVVDDEETTELLLAAVQQNTSLEDFHPVLRGSSCQVAKSSLQQLLARNRAFRRARELTTREALPAALLAGAAAQLSAIEQGGSAATHTVLRHWMEHLCV